MSSFISNYLLPSTSHLVESWRSGTNKATQEESRRHTEERQKTERGVAECIPSNTIGVREWRFWDPPQTHVVSCLLVALCRILSCAHALVVESSCRCLVVSCNNLTSCWAWIGVATTEGSKRRREELWQAIGSSLVVLVLGGGDTAPSLLLAVVPVRPLRLQFPMVSIKPHPPMVVAQSFLTIVDFFFKEFVFGGLYYGFFNLLCHRFGTSLPQSSPVCVRKEILLLAMRMGRTRHRSQRFPRIKTIRLNRSHMSWFLGFLRIHSSAAPSGFDQVHIQVQYCCGPSNFVQWFLPRRTAQNAQYLITSAWGLSHLCLFLAVMVMVVLHRSHYNRAAVSTLLPSWGAPTHPHPLLHLIYF